VNRGELTTLIEQKIPALLVSDEPCLGVYASARSNDRKFHLLVNNGILSIALLKGDIVWAFDKFNLADPGIFEMVARVVDGFINDVLLDVGDDD